jgi:hypothetical protein
MGSTDSFSDVMSVGKPAAIYPGLHLVGTPSSFIHQSLVNMGAASVFGIQQVRFLPPLSECHI